MKRALLLATTAAVALLVRAQPSSAPPHFSLVDDRGEAVRDQVRLCLSKELTTSCFEGPPFAIPPALAPFDSVTVEGPRHGPAQAHRNELALTPEGGYRLVIPRKAELTVRNLPAEPLAVSLYLVDDPAFRKPAFRQERVKAASLYVPAGSYVASLSSGRRAPDLHRLEAPPGTSRSLDYHSREGWSLVVRVQSAADRLALAGARVERAAAGDGARARGAGGGAETDASGIALLSGITDWISAAVVHHPGFVDSPLYGLTASPGSFTLRDVEMRRGGTLLARVRLDGRAAVGARCLVLDLPAFAGAAAEPAPLAETRSDVEGLCAFRRLAEGSYWVRALPEGAANTQDTRAPVSEGHETRIEIDLERIPVEGTVDRGEEPAPSMKVEMFDFARGAGAQTRIPPAAEATTDELGDYHATLWQPGEYFFVVREPSGVSAAMKRVTVDEEGASVDFHLGSGALAGLVVDKGGEPVAEASVVLSWNDHDFRAAATGADGSFSFPLTGAGTADLGAQKEGYRASEHVQVAVTENATPAPVVLRLVKADTVRGTLLAGEAPVAGAWVESYAVAAGYPPASLGAQVSGDDGGFELASAPGPTTRVFASGARCPLSLFILVNASSEAQPLACATTPAALVLTIEDAAGRPLPHQAVLLSRGGQVVPSSLLLRHLSRYGLSGESDGGGHLFLVGLSPGDYDLFLLAAASEQTVALGSRSGYLTTAHLAALETTELELKVDLGAAPSR